VLNFHQLLGRDLVSVKPFSPEPFDFAHGPELVERLTAEGLEQPEKRKIFSRREKS